MNEMQTVHRMCVRARARVCNLHRFGHMESKLCVLKSSLSIFAMSFCAFFECESHSNFHFFFIRLFIGLDTEYNEEVKVVEDVKR